MEARNAIINSMPQSFHQYIDAFIDSNDLKEAKKKIRPLSLLLSKDEEDHDDTTNLEFLEHILKEAITIDVCNPDFIQGQPYLESMSRQLKVVSLYVDDKNQYKSDGLDKNKGKLDHHKGVYGALAMLKCIVDDYPYATLKAFAKVKVFFLHAAETELHFWSVYYQNGGVFDLWREANIQVKPDFQDKGDFSPDLVQFC
ncbi:hypothetical protein BCV72DRAFT_330229 [Rhizopus microsporus var. microsporus]|uniref:Uncharacterized protein n=1 Tax=Rhizopus microsporus var. microsporus TaxID=86635 RepID=A0A1X0R161_RHIZD|nr:hypothetical protein BCV72DRAFT_330229 [Rhizopus microsporus var. microsporus]